MIVFKIMLYIIEREREKEGDYNSWRRKDMEGSQDFKKVMRKDEPYFYNIMKKINKWQNGRPGFFSFVFLIPESKTFVRHPP